jgi:hypothetical protein
MPAQPFGSVFPFCRWGASSAQFFASDGGVMLIPGHFAR